MRKIKNDGLSLIEILVVVAIFAILGILATQSVLLTLRGSRKSEAQVKVRGNLDYALAVIERQLRNADGLSACTGLPSPTVSYTDQYGNLTSFACQGVGSADSFVASASSRLTSSTEVKLVAPCQFTCLPASGGTQASVDIVLTGQDAAATGAEAASVTVKTKVFLRLY